MNTQQNYLCKGILLFFLFSWPIFCQAQLFVEGEEWLENKIPIDENGEAWNLRFEEWCGLRENPLNINYIGELELRKLGFLSDYQISAILSYRKKYGSLKSLGELMGIEELDYYDWRLLQTLVYIGEGEEPKDSTFWKRAFLNGKHIFTLRTDIPLYRRVGYQDNTYKGPSFYQALRYKYEWSNHLSWGFQAEKDSGEPFFSQQNKSGYDYYGYYLQLSNIGKLRTLLLGDYQLSYGLGLVINNGFNIGKMASVSSLREAKGIKKHSSTDENNYFEGLALTSVFGKIEFSTFYSRRLLDANWRKDATIYSLKTDGYHRTESELVKKRKMEKQSMGAHLQWSNLNWMLGATGIYTHYDKELQPNSNQLYQKFVGRGKNFTNASLYYSYRSTSFLFRGETACSEQGKMAFLHEATFLFQPSFQLFLSHRFYDKAYSSPYANALAEGSDIKNEHAFLLSALWKPADRFSIKTYADFFYFPWATFTASSSSKGTELCTQFDWVINQKYLFSTHYKMKAKQEDYQTDSESNKLYLTYVYQHKGAISLKFIPSPLFSSQTRIDMSARKSYRRAMEKGIMFSERMSMASQSQRWKINLMGAWFYTDSYDTRLYAYEPGLLYSFSFSSFYYHGLRGVMVGQYKLSSRLSITGKYGITRYLNKMTIGTGAQQIEQPWKNDISFQLRYRF